MQKQHMIGLKFIIQLHDLMSRVAWKLLIALFFKGNSIERDINLDW